MIHRNPENQNGNRTRGMGNRNGLPYLTTKDASRTPQPARVVAARVERDPFRSGQVVAMRIEFRTAHWLYNLRMNNDQILGPLCEAWGEDETQWTDKEMTIFTEQDKFNDKIWLRFEPSKKPALKR